MFSFRRPRHFGNHPVCVNSFSVESISGESTSVGSGGSGRLSFSFLAHGRVRRRVAARIALVLAPVVLVAAVDAARAQDASLMPPAQTAGESDSNPGPGQGQAQAGPDQSSQDQTGQAQTSQDQTGQGQASQDQAGQDQAQETAGQLSVQERIRQRRAQRRATAIHDAYDHLFESYAGMGYLRFQPGASLQRTTFYGWNTGLTRYWSERFGVNLDARGYYGIAYTGLQQGTTNASDTRPKISEYNVLVGPTYRFYIQPKFSISGRVLGGFGLGNFSGDTNGIGSTHFGIWPDAVTFAGAGSLIGQFNVSPGLSLRLAGEDLATGFGSTVQNSFGFTGGFVYRFGKQ
jgi:hypothetical protein